MPRFARDDKLGVREAASGARGLSLHVVSGWTRDARGLLCGPFSERLWRS
ncbi:hypothetical protein [Rubricoccus marinus]|nr:hypothetical protein [Rubricoccus marinus]